MKNLDNKIKTHGVRKKNKSKNLTELCLEELKIKGYTKIKSRLSKKDIISIRNQIDEEFSNITTQSDQKNWLNDDEIVEAINESSNLRNKKLENVGLLDSDSKNKSKKVKKKKRFFFF